MGTLDTLKEKISGSIKRIKSTNLSSDFGKVKGLIKNIKKRDEERQNKQVQREGFKEGIRNVLRRQQPEIIYFQPHRRVEKMYQITHRGGFMETDPFSGGSPFFRKGKRKDTNFLGLSEYF